MPKNISRKTTVEGLEVEVTFGAFRLEAKKLQVKEIYAWLVHLSNLSTKKTSAHFYLSETEVLKEVRRLMDDKCEPTTLQSITKLLDETCTEFDFKASNVE